MSCAPVDLATLNELRSIMAGEFDLLIQIFISDSEQRIINIADAIANKDAESLRGAAHSFKGSSMNISAAKLTEFCRQLEFMGKDNDLADAPTVFVETQKEFNIVKDFLRKL